MSDVRAFYDGLAPLYHLVYEDWDASIACQGAALAALIEEHWGAGARVLLDAAVGIGTQALGLLTRGFHVTGSDLSLDAVRRASREAAARDLSLRCLVADFRALPLRSATADVVVVCDNALPHLETEAEIRIALSECFRCARPGGGCLISMRDYGEPPPSGTVQVHPYGERLWEGRRYDLRQVWTWRGSRYDMALEIAPLRWRARRSGHRVQDELFRDRPRPGRRAHGRSGLRRRAARGRPARPARARRDEAPPVLEKVLEDRRRRQRVSHNDQLIRLRGEPGERLPRNFRDRLLEGRAGSIQVSGHERDLIS